MMCEALRVGRNSYCRTAGPRDEEQLPQALQELAGLWPTDGYRRMTVELRRAGWVVNQKRMAHLDDDAERLMRTIKEEAV